VDVVAAKLHKGLSSHYALLLKGFIGASLSLPWFHLEDDAILMDLFFCQLDSCCLSRDMTEDLSLVIIC
jgi:hypothetical protein